jgi:hypothetical protein
MCVPRNFDPRLRLISQLHDNLSTSDRGVANTLAKATHIFEWNRFSQDVKYFCERCVVYRRAKIQPQMAATLNLLLVPPGPWHAVGLPYFKNSSFSNGFGSVLIVVDHLTRMAHFLPCTEGVTIEEQRVCFYMEPTDYMDYLGCSSLIATPNSSVACGTRFGDASNRGSTCLKVDTRRRSA